MNEEMEIAFNRIFGPDQGDLIDEAMDRNSVRKGRRLHVRSVVEEAFRIALERAMKDD